MIEGVPSKLTGTTSLGFRASASLAGDPGGSEPRLDL